MMTPMSFGSILCQAKRREPDALDRLSLVYYPIIFQYVSRRVPSYIAGDITSDVFLEMVTDIDTLVARDEATFKAWLFAIAHIRVVGYYRARDRDSVRIVPLEAASGISSPDDPTQPILQAEKIVALTSAVSMLTTKRRKIVIAR